MNVRFLTLAALSCFLVAGNAHAITSLGTGAGALVGGDLTDPENDGAADANVGYNATFFASDKPSFGAPEAAFNVFDNRVGGGSDKWCCGSAFPQIVGASFDANIVLTSFTLTSSNDTPARDPQVWRIEGSTDTTTGLDGSWTIIYDHASAINEWTARNEVLRFSAADGDALLAQAFSSFRMVTTATGATSGAFFALNEIELFGNVVPEPATVTLGLFAMGGLMLRRRRMA